MIEINLTFDTKIPSNISSASSLAEYIRSRIIEKKNLASANDYQYVVRLIDEL